MAAAARRPVRITSTWGKVDLMFDRAGQDVTVQDPGEDELVEIAS